MEHGARDGRPPVTDSSRSSQNQPQTSNRSASERLQATEHDQRSAHNQSMPLTDSPRQIDSRLASVDEPLIYSTGSTAPATPQRQHHILPETPPSETSHSTSSGFGAPNQQVSPSMGESVHHTTHGSFLLIKDNNGMERAVPIVPSYQGSQGLYGSPHHGGQGSFGLSYQGGQGSSSPPHHGSQGLPVSPHLMGNHFNNTHAVGPYPYSFYPNPYQMGHMGLPSTSHFPGHPENSLQSYSHNPRPESSTHIQPAQSQNPRISQSYSDHPPARMSHLSNSPTPQRSRASSSISKSLPSPSFELQDMYYKGISLGQYQASKCSGIKKALVIGINYEFNKKQPFLSNCVQDAKRMTHFLHEKLNFNKENIAILTDEGGVDPNVLPTRVNILRYMRWLVKDATLNDSLFFYFSGHGGQIPDEDGDEEDGLDETIHPMDYDFGLQNHIVDDEMHDIMVKTLPAGARLTAIFDCCHSGTALDLPWIYGSDGRPKDPKAKRRLVKKMSSAVGKIFDKNQGFFSALTAPLAEHHKKKDTRDMAFKNKSASGDVIMISATKDDEIARQTGFGGVMSNAFQRVIAANRDLSYMDLLDGIRQALLDGHHSQKPQLSSCHPLDVHSRFLI